MQVVILAGGFGTRLSEETDLIPKPMVKIGSEPILVHLMRYFATYGHTDFLIAGGYKSQVIADYFDGNDFPWSIQVVDTGLNTSTGGRLLRLKEKLANSFFLTYGDGLGDVNLDELYDKFSASNYIAMVTAVRPPARFGSIRIVDDRVESFNEKDPQDAGWINGGFFCCSLKIFNFLDSYEEPLEGKPLSEMAHRGLLGVKEHHGWWHPMDTLRDKRHLEAIWKSGKAPWIRNEVR